MIVRSDTPYFRQIKSTISSQKIITWAISGSADYQVDWSHTGSLHINDSLFKIAIDQSVLLEDLVFSIVLSLELGMSPSQIATGLKHISSLPMRLEMKQGINGCFLIDDAYNNDLLGLESALDFLQAYDKGKSRTVVLSDILHAGVTDEVLYREVNTLLRHKKIDRLLGVGTSISRQASVFNLHKDFFESTADFIRQFPSFNDEVILLKGARPFHFERISELLEEKCHRTVLEVYLQAMKYNLDEYRKVLTNNVRLMVMVKANAYGLGIVEVSNFLKRHKVDYLGVAYLDEAIALRREHIDVLL